MSILTKEEIKRLIKEQKDLIVSPVLDLDRQAEAGSINIRIGTEFIVAKKSECPVLEPRKLSSQEIRKVQEKVYREIGEVFVLHPLQLVLAGALEFISLPNYLCGHVETRSRYGRCGVIVATATYIHPGWKGCLTLELVNYGDTPIKIECGLAIAQLILQKAEPASIIDPPQKFKPIPLGPEFVQMEGDPDFDLIGKLKSSR